MDILSYPAYPSSTCKVSSTESSPWFEGNYWFDTDGKWHDEDNNIVDGNLEVTKFLDQTDWVAGKY